jgi:formiminotetrahydrofolate cyclodeaminase
MRGATEVPLEVMRACQAAAQLGVTVARCGNPSASSDAGVALELLGAALRGAAANTRINIASIEDQGFAAGAEAEARRLERAMEGAVGEARAFLVA